MAKDYYGILNIKKNATDDEIKKAYRKLAIKYHPDKNKSKAAEERFKEIAEAYELLTDRRKRYNYDQFGIYDKFNDCRNQKGGIFTYNFHGDPRATFAQFFGAANPFGAFYASRHTSFHNSSAFQKQSDERPTAMPTPSTTGRSMPTKPPPPPPFTSASRTTNATSSTPPPPPPPPPPAPKKDPPVQHDLLVSLKDIESGCTKKMRILRLVTEENGQKHKEEKVLNLNIKPGWKEGTKITFPEEGDRAPGVIPADIIFIIRDKPHPLFKRVGNDIRYKAEISLKHALCGTVIEVPTLQGDTITIDTHAEIIEPETVKCFKGRGLPFHREPSKRGDLYVDIVVQFPKTLEFENKVKLNEALPD